MVINAFIIEIILVCMIYFILFFHILDSLIGPLAE